MIRHGCLFRPLEPFLIEANVPVRPGQIRRASLLPVVAVVDARRCAGAGAEFEKALSRGPDAGTSSEIEAAVRNSNWPRRMRSLKSPCRRAGTDQRRSLARIGPRGT